MSNNKEIIGVIVIIVILLLIANSPSINFLHAPKKLFSIISDQKTQLAQDYTTYFSGQLDSGNPQLPTERSGGGSNDKFIYNPNVFIGGNSIQIANDGHSGGQGGSLTSKHNFYGQEVVVLISGAGNSYNGGDLGMSVDPDSPIQLKFIPHTLDLTKVDVYKAGVLFQTITVGNPFYISFSAASSPASAEIDYWGYKAQYSCDLGQDEVWIQENFAQPFSINDLTFIPTKFCKDTRPFVLRDIQQGETVIYPDPIPSFNRGDILQIPQDKIGVANYATIYVNGVNNKCATNEANIKVAGKWICSQVIKPVEIVVQCQQNSDCPVPLKNSCPNYFTGCVNQKCVYDDTILNSTACKNEVVTIIHQVQLQDYRAFVNVTSDNTFLFTEGAGTDTFSIGNAQFTSHTTSSCQMPSDVDYFTPSPSCFNAAVNFNGNTYNVQDSQVVDLTPYIKFIYYGGGQLTRTNNQINNQLTGSYYFTILRDALSIDIGDTSEVLKGSIKLIQANIRNSLPDGKLTLKVNQKVKVTNQNLPEKTYELDVRNGDNTFSFNMDTSNLGINQFNIQVFYKVNNNLIPSNQFIFNYNIVDQLSNLNQPIVVYTNNTNQNPAPATQGNSKIIFYVVGGIIIFFIILRFL